MRSIIALLRLTRLDSSLLGALGTFVALTARTHDWAASAGMAMPILFAYMCTFIANDLDDLERDRINHPTRALPTGNVTPWIAATAYFTCLGSALFSTKYFVSQRDAFGYYAMLVLSISYTYVTEWLPALKAPYVAAIVASPLLIVAASNGESSSIYAVAYAVFFFVLGREICMDVLDRRGDVVSFMHSIPPQPLSVFAFVLQVIALFLLAAHIVRLGQAFILSGMASLLAWYGLCWFKLGRQRHAIALMKGQLLLGIYFLT